MTILISILFALPLIAIMLYSVMVSRLSHTSIKILQISLIGVLLGISISILYRYHSYHLMNVGSWPTTFSICLMIDKLNLLMLNIFLLCVFAVMLYSFNDETITTHLTSFYCGSWLLILGVIGALLTYDLFNLYVWCEVMLLGTFIVLLSHNTDGTKYLLHYATMNIIGTMLLLLAIALLYGKTGNLHYGVISQILQQDDTHHITPLLMLLLVGLAMKGAIFPFYFWLTTTYPKASASATLLLSSLTTKVIMLILLRLAWIWPPLHTTLISYPFLMLGCATMLLGVLSAASQPQIRDILSFHIISQLGYIVLAIFISNKLAIIAAVYFMIHNIFVKSNLLMISGIIERHYTDTSVYNLDQLLKVNLPFAVIFFISAMSLVGLPPLSGFWGKFLVIKAAIDAKIYYGAFFAILVGLFTLYSMTKIWRFCFCEPGPQQPQQTFFIATPQKLALLLTLLFPVIMGIYPNLLVNTLDNVSTELMLQAQSPENLLGIYS